MNPSHYSLTHLSEQYKIQRGVLRKPGLIDWALFTGPLIARISQVI